MSREAGSWAEELELASQAGDGTERGAGVETEGYKCKRRITAIVAVPVHGV
jgi:hypothetical protein